MNMKTFSSTQSRDDYERVLCMKIGILQCDDVLESFQSQFGTYPGMLIELLSHIRSEWTFKQFDLRENQLPSQYDEYDAYITTGSRDSVNDPLPWLPTFFNFIQTLHQQKHPCVGICFGHQAIAKALGGEVQESERGWGIGISENERVLQQSWMQPKTNPLKVIVSHKEQVIQLPKNATLLYRSDFCPNYMLQVEKHFLTIQGHPEFSEEYAKTLIQHRAHKIPKSTLEAGLASLEGTADSKILGEWIATFIEQAKK